MYLRQKKAFLSVIALAIVTILSSFALFLSYEMNRRLQLLNWQKEDTDIQTSLDLYIQTLPRQLDTLFRVGRSSGYVSLEENPETLIPVIAGITTRHNLLSGHEHPGKGRCQFDSVSSKLQIESDWIDPQGNLARDLELAWIIEDLSIVPANPGFDRPSLKAVHEIDWRNHSQSSDIFASSLNSFSYPSIPAIDPLPFLPEYSPALIPVVENLRFVFGIFASGSSTNENKTIRMRFYLGGLLQNPYNRKMLLHSGYSFKPRLWMEISNLPSIRIHNLSLNVSSHWIDLNKVRNEFSDTNGISGYIRLPRFLPPGQGVFINEPDQKGQPEGLARLVLDSFPVRPADTISIEFSSSRTLSQIALYPISHTGELSDDALLLWKNVPLRWQELQLERADDIESPFLISGSLQFRREMAAFSQSVSLPLFKHSIDPRKRTIDFSSELQTATSMTLKVSDIFQANAEDDPFSLWMNAGELSNLPFPILFSWPQKAPDSLASFMDYPEITQLPFPAWPDSRMQIYHLNKLSQSASSDLLKRIFHNAEKPACFVRFPININTPFPQSWTTFFENHLLVSNGIYELSRYNNPSLEDPSEKLTLSELEINAIAQNLAQSARSTPILTLADWLEKGFFANALQTVLKIGKIEAGRCQAAFAFQFLDCLTALGNTLVVHIRVRSKIHPEHLKSVRVWCQAILEADRNELKWVIIKRDYY